MTLVIVSSWAVLIAGVYLRVIFRLWNRSYRRRHYRAALTVPVSIAFAGLTRHGVTTELSFSGLSLLLPEPVEAGTRLAIELDLARDRVPIAGVVSRCSADEHGHQIGIEFERIPPEYEALLTEEIVNTTLLAPLAPDRSSKEPSRRPAPAIVSGQA